MKVSHLLLLAVTITCMSLVTTYGPEINTRHILDNFKNSPKEDLFKVFHMLFEKEYKLDSEEGLRKFQIFTENLKEIEKWNEEGKTDNYGINEFTDMTEEEFNKNYLSKPDLEEEFNDQTESQQREQPMRFLQEKVPYTIDWTPFMNPARGQGPLGVCALFTKNASMEALYYKNFGEKIILSPQYPNDCGNYNGNVNFYINNGVVLEEDYPFTKENSYCPESELDSKRFNIIDGSRWNKSKTLAEFRELLSEGPLFVAFAAVSERLQAWSPKKSAYFNPSPDCLKNIDHSVLAVGIMMVEGREVIKVRNSWGSGWGDKGYFYVPVDNSCGMTSKGSYIKVKRKESFTTRQKSFYADCNSNTDPVTVTDGVARFPATFTTGANSAISNPSSILRHGTISLNRTAWDLP